MLGNGATAVAAAAGPAVEGEPTHLTGQQPFSSEWSWTTEGWKSIPTASIGRGTLRAWNAVREWFTYSDNVATAAQDPWASYQPGSARHDDDWAGWKKPEKKKDGNVPEWDGKSEHRLVYFRKIDLWEATTGVEPQDRAVRLLQELKGEAFEKLENIQVATLQCDNGIDIFKEAIVAAYEPIEDYRVGKIMDEFLDDFSRKRDQEIVDYTRCWFTEINKVEKVAGELVGKWKAHLYLKKMRLSPYQKTQLLTASLGDYTVESLEKAALRTFPNVKELGGAKTPGAAFQGFGAGGRGRRKPGKGRGKGFRRKGARRAFEVDQEGEDEEDDQDEEPEEEEAEEDFEEDASGEEGEEEPAAGAEGEQPDVPYELEEAIKESNAFLTRAKKQRAEVEKARGYFKKGASPGKDDEKIKGLKSKLPCAKCGALGHWFKDKICPKFAQQFKDGKGPKRRTKKGFMVFYDVYVVSLAGKQLSFPALVDTACAKSVVGPSSSEELIRYCKQNGWPHKVVPDEEPFRFGPGKRVWSKNALIIVTVWAEVVLIIRISIVEWDPVPFLISKYALKRIGANIDLDEGLLSFKRLSKGVEHLHDLESGHVAVELVKLGSPPFL